MPAPNDSTYVVSSVTFNDLDSNERDACVAIITTGGAVDPESARTELPYATAIAVVRKDGQVVGVGTIKGKRAWYAEYVGRKSGAKLKSETLELGYVAVEEKSQNHGLATRLVQELLATTQGPYFATTDNEYMKRTLTKAGFAQTGKEWKGNRGHLSLWIRNRPS